jgi:very-short-patch-repair endonuclease
MSKKLTQKEVLERFKKVHGDEYDYSLVEYVNNRTDVIILCHIHGEFLQKPENHFIGKGCPDCGIIKQTNSTRKTKEKFIEEAKLVHGDKNDYSLVEYVNTDTKISIICKKDRHGIFQQAPSRHLQGSGCPKCGLMKGKAKLTKSTEEAIEKFIKVHGDKYDYSLVEYVGVFSKVSIICKKDGHGIFKQRPDTHFQGSGCPDCGKYIRSEKRKLNQKEVLDRFKKVHGDEYDYSLVEYVGAHTKVKIICKKDGHDIFEHTANNHFQGNGCPKCSRTRAANTLSKSTKEFIKQAKEVHPDNNYGYEKVEYKRSAKTIIIVCPIHGDFEQRAGHHLMGSGCSKCGVIKSSKIRQLSVNEFIDRSNLIHNNFYGYEKVKYVNFATPVKIICPLHGDFYQKPHGHLSGKGCGNCGITKRADKKRKTTEQFIQEANLKHGGIYKYDNVDYKAAQQNVSITCKIHGDFLQIADHHLRGRGCPKCINKNEGRLAIILNEIGVVFRNHRINNRYFDFYLPEYDLIIERDGEQHYFEPFMIVGSRMKTIEQNHQNDIEKTKLAKSKGHQIYRIPYWLSEEDEKKEIQNILNGQPTYPDVPNLEQAKTKPLPN